MKPESDAWQSLKDHAASQLHRGFADRVLRAAQGPTPAAWQQLQDHAAAQLHAGFAERVLRAVRTRIQDSSVFSQLALGAATAAICVAAVLFYHNREFRIQEERAIADWQQLATEAQYFGLTQ